MDYKQPNLKLFYYSPSATWKYQAFIPQALQAWVVSGKGKKDRITIDISNPSIIPIDKFLMILVP